MAKTKNAILQIVPRAPGSRDGVGDYALTLARGLRAKLERQTIFATPDPAGAVEICGFPIRPLDAITDTAEHDIILHYVNYGYQNRGIPFALLKTVRRLRPARLVTIFHEIFASAPAWQSAFWLQPVQKLLARRLAHMSDACVVSSEVMRDALQRFNPPAPVIVRPVSSSLGEPALTPDQFSGRDPHRWAIFGGTQLLERSLHSFMARRKDIPAMFEPNELLLIGGEDSSSLRHKVALIVDLPVKYSPALEAAEASALLLTCSFGWMDYFRDAGALAPAILKSGSFTAYCAHGLIPVFPRAGDSVSLEGDALPGPFFVSADGAANFPLASERASVAGEIYRWYQRHASANHLVDGIAAALVKT